METQTEKILKVCIVRSNSNLAKALRTIALMGAREKLAKETKEKAVKTVRELSGKADKFTLPDGTELATDTEQDGKRTCNLEKLESEFSEAYVACVERGDSFRVLRPKPSIALLK